MKPILAIFLGISLLASAARADHDVELRSGDAGWHQLRVGAGPLAGGGIAGVGSAFFLSLGVFDRFRGFNADHPDRHFGILDGQATGILGLGARTTSQGTVSTEYRIVGRFDGGVQAFRVIPLNLALEDLLLADGPSGERRHALLGTTLHVPFRFDGVFLGLSGSIGARVRTGRETVTAWQGRVHLVTKPVFLDAWWVATLGTRDEQRFVAQATFNVPGSDVQVGALVERDLWPGVTRAFGWVAREL